MFKIYDQFSNKKRGNHISVSSKYFKYLSKTYIIDFQVVCSIIENRGFVISNASEIYVLKKQTYNFIKKNNNSRKYD